VSTPLVSVLLASRDGERFLEASLASLAAQTWPALEIVAVDDGSRDRTGDILRAFAAAHGRTRLLRTEGVGLAAALAMAARAAEGAFLARQDDDDLSAPERIERQMRHLEAHSEIAVLGTHARVIDPRGETVGESAPPATDREIRRMLERAPPFVHGSVIMRRAAYEAAGGYRAPFAASQDYDLWLRIAPRAGLANLSESLYAWRAHPGGVFARAREDQLFFAALGRVFADERAQKGADSIDAFAAASDREAFLARYDRAGALLAEWGERLARDGRVAEARRQLARALGRGGGVRALAWWCATWGVGWTGRARRAARGGA
jgi:glycosyltransferase involved in cell wall biosynthesis